MASMTTRAAVLHEPGTDWEITELDLDEPKDYEVLIRYKAAGLCHSDEHIRAEGGSHIRLPLVGGHEGAGVVEAVGPGVTRVTPGDHVVTSYIPACGKCRYCSTGHQNLCDRGLYAGVGCLQDETFRFHRNGEDYGGFCALGTFSDHTVVSEYSCVRIDDDIPFEVACLVGCGVTTGWCSAVRAGETRPGETVVIMGVGGVGINAVQGAALCRRRDVVAIDPNPFKLDAAKRLGATHAFTDIDEAREELIDAHPRPAGRPVRGHRRRAGARDHRGRGQPHRQGRAGDPHLGEPRRRAHRQPHRLAAGGLAQAHPGIAGRRRQPHLRDAQPPRPLPLRPPQARRDHHRALQPGGGQRGLPRPAGRQERPRRDPARDAERGGPPQTRPRLSSA